MTKIYIEGNYTGTPEVEVPDAIVPLLVKGTTVIFSPHEVDVGFIAEVKFLPSGLQSDGIPALLLRIEGH